MKSITPTQFEALPEGENCNRTVSFKDGLNERYYKCDKKPFMLVEYKSPFNSGIVKELLCKSHYNHFIKNCNRISKKTGFDFCLTEALNKLKNLNGNDK